MEMKTIRRNKNNSVTKEDYEFWKQMEAFKEKEWDGLIAAALFLNDNWLDNYEVN